MHASPVHVCGCDSLVYVHLVDSASNKTINTKAIAIVST